MENNSQSNIKYIPYKEIAKKRHENIIRKKRKKRTKINIIYYHLNKKRKEQK